MNVKVTLFLLVALLAINIIGASAAELPAGVQKLIAYQTNIATSLTFLAAFLAGLISFTSPCGIAVIPAFLSVVFKDKHNSKRMTAVFSLGLISAFAILGIVAGLVSNIFDQFKIMIAIISGIFLIIFGMMTLINQNIGKTCTAPHIKNTSSGVYFLGVTLGLGWTPCIGAVLSSIFFLALNIGSVLMSTLLAMTFAAGVITPLMCIAYYADKKNWQPTGRIVSFRLFGKHCETYLYNLLAGALLIFVGIIMLTWKGTGFFMAKIPLIIPWNMELLVQWNHNMVASAFFRTGIANAIGIGLIVLVIIGLYYSLRKKQTEKVNNAIPK